MESPIFFGEAHITVTLDGKTYAGVTEDGGEKLVCDYLKYVDEWRLRCKIGEGKEIALYRVES